MPKFHEAIVEYPPTANELSRIRGLEDLAMAGQGFGFNLREVEDIDSATEEARRALKDMFPYKLAYEVMSYRFGLHPDALGQRLNNTQIGERIGRNRRQVQILVFAAMDDWNSRVEQFRRSMQG